MLIKEVVANIAAQKKRSTWDKGVQKYAVEILEDYADLNRVETMPKLGNLEPALLNGAKDREQYSQGGCALGYDDNILNRLFPPSQRRRISPSADLLAIQARALYQAYWLVVRTYRRIK